MIFDNDLLLQEKNKLLYIMKRSNLVWVVIAVLVVALLGAGIFIYMQHKEMSDFKEQVEIDKQRSELEKGYSD